MRLSNIYFDPNTINEINEIKNRGVNIGLCGCILAVCGVFTTRKMHKSDHLNAVAFN